jgi:hypothetical protein
MTPEAAVEQLQVHVVICTERRDKSSIIHRISIHMYRTGQKKQQVERNNASLPTCVTYATPQDIGNTRNASSD